MHSLPGPHINFLSGTTIPDYESERIITHFSISVWSMNLLKLSLFATGPITNLLTLHPDGVKKIFTDNYSKSKLYSLVQSGRISLLQCNILEFVSNNVKKSYFHTFT